MARKLDHKSEEINQLGEVHENISLLRKKLREQEKKKELLEAILKKSLATSKEGTVNGHVRVRLTESERRSVTIAKVMDVCPEKANELIQTSVSSKIKLV